jgi:phosphate starvation-inducible PhoH-like protein
MKSNTSKKHVRREIRAERRKERQLLKFHPEKVMDVMAMSVVHSMTRESQAAKEYKPLKALNPKQAQYLNIIKNNIITFATGPAGTGKTFVAAAYAAEQLKEGNIDKILITRPAVECGEKFGFLPGDLDEKFSPFLDPFEDVFTKRLGKSQYEYFLTHKRIEAKPLGFMRGDNFNNCIVILDEGQNTTVEQMRTFLTRIGRDCKVIIEGDLDQSDIRVLSGMQDAMRRLRDVDSVGKIEFEVDDIVRSGICRDIVLAYRNK